MQSLKQSTWIHSQSHKDDESMMKMSGRALAKLTRLLCQYKMAKRVSLSWPKGLNRSLHEIEPLGSSLHWSSRWPDALVNVTRCTPPVTDRWIYATCPLCLTFTAWSQRSTELVLALKLWSDAPYHDLTQPRSVWSSHVHVPPESDRTYQITMAPRHQVGSSKDLESQNSDRTHPQRPLLLTTRRHITIRQPDRTHHWRVRSQVVPASG
jgi:hypothetical protein